MSYTKVLTVVNNIDYMLPESENMPNFDLTLGIDTSKLPKT